MRRIARLWIALAVVLAVGASGAVTTPAGAAPLIPSSFDSVTAVLVDPNLADLRVEGRLRANGAPVSGREVAVTLTNLTFGGPPVVEEVDTDAAGRFVAHATAERGGLHRVTVAFAGDATYGPSTLVHPAETEIRRVFYVDAPLELAGLPGEPTTLSATLSEARPGADRGIPGRTLTFYVGFLDEPFFESTAVTNAAGVASLQWTPPHAGQFHVFPAWEEDFEADWFTEIPMGVVTTVLDVAEWDVRIRGGLTNGGPRPSAEHDCGPFGQACYVDGETIRGVWSFDRHRPDGSYAGPLVGQQVTIGQIGDEVLTATTDAEGRAVLEFLTAKEHKGPWHLAPSFAGVPGLYEPAEATFAEMENPAVFVRTTLEFVGSVFGAPGQPVDLSVRATSADGAPIVGMELEWRYTRSPTEQAAFTAVTDATGRAAVTHQFPEKGRWPLHIAVVNQSIPYTATADGRLDRPTLDVDVLSGLKVATLTFPPMGPGVVGQELPVAATLISEMQPVAAEEIEFTITGPDGARTGMYADTGSDGVARAVFVPATAGTYTVSAEWRDPDDEHRVSYEVAPLEPVSVTVAARPAPVTPTSFVGALLASAIALVRTVLRGLLR
jgi:hypothetical protein